MSSPANHNTSPQKALVPSTWMVQYGRKEGRKESKLHENSSYFPSLPVDYKNLKNSTNPKGCEPDSPHPQNLFQSIWKHLFLIAFGFEN